MPKVSFNFALAGFVGASLAWPAPADDDGPCPTHALEGTTPDGQRARIVFAACPDETRVVTAIDLATEWPCNCP